MNSLKYTVLIFLLFSIELQAGEINDIRIWPAPERTRVVFDIDKPLSYRLFSLENPDRLVLDFDQTALKSSLSKVLPKTKKLLKKVRSSNRPDNRLRIVFDLKTAVHPKSFLLQPNTTYGHRLVLDLKPSGVVATKPAVIKKSYNRTKQREIVIAIDAGHGGEDPGARGHKGTKEKDVVLKIARQLYGLVDKERGMRPVMIRDGDYFMRLKERTKKAREHEADLFVSIHADAFRDPRAKGASVYVLSQKGASSEAARWLAESENAADLIGGVSLDDKDNVLASVLLDLSQTASIEASFDVGSAVIGELSGMARMHKKRVQQGGFVVLKSPDIPSILVETAFLSNHGEEKKLRTKRYQKKVAKAIMGGVRRYFLRYPPPGTRYAMHKHTIHRGETLSEIAVRYGVTMASIKTVNNLRGDTLKIGQVLKIPGVSDV